MYLNELISFQNLSLQLYIRNTPNKVNVLLNKFKKKNNSRNIYMITPSFICSLRSAISANLLLWVTIIKV